jgi:hypothetical protein
MELLRAQGTQFIRPDGRPIMLAGSHTWDNMLGMFDGEDHAGDFDFAAYLAWLKAHQNNCTRLWRWEVSAWTTPAGPRAVGVFPDYCQPWLRPQTGGPRANDGLWKYDLAQPDPRYDERLLSRVRDCEAAGIYCVVMLFEGNELQTEVGGKMIHQLNHWSHPANNVNGVNGEHFALYDLGNVPCLAVEVAYVERVVRLLNPYPNVLWEICNEGHVSSLAWQYRLVNFIHDLESGLPYWHPVGMTALFQGSDADLIAGPADWISPNGNYQRPGPNTSGRPMILDTDHLWGMGGDTEWVRLASQYGYSMLFMDAYRENVVPTMPPGTDYEPVRLAMGAAQVAANAGELIPDVEPVPDPVGTSWVKVEPASGDTNTIFSFSAFVAFLPTTAWFVVAKGGARTYIGPYPGSAAGKFTGASKLAPGTYTYQVEYRVSGVARFVNPPAGSTIMVSEAGPEPPPVPPPADGAWQFSLRRLSGILSLAGPDGTVIWQE